MTVLLRDNARVEIARSIYRDVINENDFLYFYIGRTLEWNDEESPETPVDSVSYNNAAHRNTLFLKRVQTSDIVMMARRIDWAVDTVYDSYDDNYSSDYTAYSGAEKLSLANFYVITDEFNVYKCIYNSKNSESTAKPTGTSSSSITTEDGYIWKYMFTVGASDQQRFLSSGYIPVRKVVNAGEPAFDVNGALDSVTVTAQGSGYSQAPSVVISGDGVGASATAVLGSGATAGKIISVTVNASGSGYSFANISFSSGAAAATANLGGTETDTTHQAVENAAVGGTVDRIVMLEIGLDYIQGDVTCFITGDGEGAEGNVQVSEDGLGKILSVEITNVGSGYSFANISFVNNVGNGAGATARVVLSPYFGHGANSQKELFATAIGISTNLTNETYDIFVGNDFRQIGLIKNPMSYGTTTNFQATTGTTCYVINVSDHTKYALDDNITTDEGGQFTVIQKRDLNSDGTVESIYLLPIIPVIGGTSILTNTTQNFTNLSINSVTEPEIDNRTGEILYIDNKRYITRSSDQIEKLKAILTF
jgi:hypothetical protein